MRSGTLFTTLCVIVQTTSGQISQDSIAAANQHQWAIEISSIADKVDFLGSYQRSFSFDPNIAITGHLHTTTAFSGQVGLGYHSYRRTSTEIDDAITLFTGGVSFILFKTLVLGSGLYHFKANELR